MGGRESDETVGEFVALGDGLKECVGDPRPGGMDRLSGVDRGWSLDGRMGGWSGMEGGIG